MNFFSASCTDVGKKRKLNEDSILDRPDIGLWAVADGMGGHEAGEVASAKIVAALGELPRADDAGVAADLAGEALRAINSELVAMGHMAGPRRTIGSTVVALTISPGRFACVWAGDSRAYMVRERKIAQITTDHSLVNELVRSGLLNPADAGHHPDANVITRAVGAAEELQLDRVEGAAQSGDFFVLASDGVTRVMRDEELLDTIMSANPRQAAEIIRDTVLERGAPDNLSVVIVRIH